MSRLETRVRRLPDVALLPLATKVYVRLQARMESLGASALRYGWDWPTANVLHPRLVARFTAIRREAIRRADAASMSVTDWCLSL